MENLGYGKSKLKKHHMIYHSTNKMVMQTWSKKRNDKKAIRGQYDIKI